MSAKKLEEILEETQVISSMISEARRLLAENKSFDLANLYNKISILCKKAQSVGANQKSKVHYILREIVEDLNRLDEEITAMHKKNSASITEENKKRATKAYSQDKKES